MVSYVEIDYYQGGKEEEYTINQLQDIVTAFDTSNGRFYSIIPTPEMIQQGIRCIKLGFVSLSKISIHAPGA